jgi:cation diffusion facilitator family transporter
MMNEWIKGTMEQNDAQDARTTGPAEKSGSSKVIFAAIASNLGIAAAKFVVAGMTGSAAMVAEAIHSTADTGNELLLLIGERNRTRKPDARHPFGYGKVVYFWALIVALSVFTLGGGVSIYHGVHAIMHPKPPGDPMWNYVVLGVAALFEGYSWNVSRLEINKKKKPGRTLWQAFRSSKDASVFTVFVEDSAALVTIVVAAMGIGLGQLTGNPYFDPGASVVIGLILVVAAFVLARETGDLLVGETMGINGTEQLRAIFDAERQLDAVGDLLSMQMGPDRILLTASVQFTRGMRIDEVEATIARLEKNVHAAFPAIKQIYFESGALRTGWNLALADPAAP